MRYGAVLPLLCLCALAACGRRSGLYADRSAPPAPAAAEAGEVPRFVGRWAATAAQCEHPWVMEARSLKALGWSCEFDRLDPSPAGYAAVAVCRAGDRIKPSRLMIMAPNQARISAMTISGGPFRYAVALQRCGQP